MISIVIPIFNEEENIKRLHSRISPILNSSKEEWELIFVNDGSNDNSTKILKDLARNEKNTKGIIFSRNFGQYAAVSAGIRNAKGDAIIVMDADLQEPPELIPTLLEKWKLGYKAVYTSALSRKDSFFRRICGKIFYKLFGKASLWGNVQNISEMRLIDKDIARAFSELREKPRFLKGLFFWFGYSYTIVTYEKQKREYGISKYPFSKLLKLALDGIFSFSNIPLQFILFTGTLFLILSIIYGIASLIFYIFGNNTLLFSPILFGIIFMGSIQLIALGIIGEYLGRTYDEARQRPNFIIEERINF